MKGPDVFGDSVDDGKRQNKDALAHVIISLPSIGTKIKKTLNVRCV